MPYPVRLLGEGEQVVDEFHPHWAYLGWPLAALTAAVGLALGAAIGMSGAPAGVLYVFLALVGLSLLWLAMRSLRRAATSIVVTSARVIRRGGVLSRITLEIRLERINELSSHQSLGGRVLGAGEVRIEVGGETGVVVLDHMPRPQLVQSIISEQVSKWHRSLLAPPVDPRPSWNDTPPAGTTLQGSAPGVITGPTPGVGERLVQLQELRRRGIVSDAEYEVKRQQLLRDL